MSDDIVDELPIVPVPITTDADPVKAANDQTAKTLEAIKTRARKWDNQAKVDLDVDFYAVLVFQSARQRKEFFDKAAWNLGDKFLDGIKVAEYLGITLTREAWTPFEPTPSKESAMMIRMDQGG